MSIAVIGYVTKDEIVVNGKTEHKIGGTAFYSGITLANLGIKTRIITKLSLSDKNLLKALNHRNISLSPYFCNATTCFRNVYHGTHRDQFVESIAEPFSIKEINVDDCRFVHLGPLTKADIPLEFLRHLKSLGLTISLDVQGYLREIRNKKVALTDWDEKEKFMKHISILKADAKEAEILTGKKWKQAAKSLADMGASEVIITDGHNGSLIYSNDKVFDIPAFKPAVMKDVTGCGDTYIAAYLAKRLTSDNLKECGLFAARCATAKIEKGIFR